MAANVVELNDVQLQKMLSNSSLRREFPFLSTALAKSSTSSCGGCKRKQRRNTVDYGNLRTSFAALSSEKKKRLKELLAATQVVVNYKNARGASIKLKF